MQTAEDTPAPAPPPEVPTPPDDEQREAVNQNNMTQHESEAPTPPDDEQREAGNQNNMTQHESEERQIEILKTVMAHKNGLIFEWGKKAKVLDACLQPLNALPIFGGMLKSSTLGTRWRKAEKIAEEIIADEEQFVKLAQNGGKEMSELDKLYMLLAKRMKKHRVAKQKEKEEIEANAKDAQMRLRCALTSVSRRCGYDSIAQADKILGDEAAGAATENDEEESPQPEHVKGKWKSPSAEPVGEKEAGDGEKGSNEEGKDKGAGSYGRGTKEGQNKRAKYDPALRPDRAGSEDPLNSIAGSSNRLFAYLEKQGENDAKMMAEIVKAQKMSAQAERLRQAAAATESFVKAQQAGVDLPAGLMRMFEDTE